MPQYMLAQWNWRGLMNFKPSHCHLFECYCVANKCLKMILFPPVGVLIPWQPHWFDFGSISQNWRLFRLPAAITTKSLDNPLPSKKAIVSIWTDLRRYSPSSQCSLTWFLPLLPTSTSPSSWWLFWDLKSWCHRLSCNHSFVTPSHGFSSLKSRMPGADMLTRHCSQLCCSHRQHLILAMAGH